MSQSNLVFIGVDYEEFEPSTYRGIVVDYKDGHYRFKSEHSPARDLKSAWAFIREREFPEDSICNMSSVDSFVMDGGVLEIQE